MRSPGVIHFLLLLLLLLTYFWADGQDYVITSKGDSIPGQIKPLLFGVDKKVQVIDENKKKQTFAIFQVRSYRYKGDTFQPVKGPEGYTFMQLIKSGYLSLYYYQLPNQVTFDGTYLMKRDGKGMDVPNLGFKKSMKNFLKDCENVTDAIDAGTLSRKNIEAVVDEYNTCITGRTISSQKDMTAQAEQKKQIGSWDALEQKVKEQSDFEGKQNALDMIQEIKGKLSRSEKIPNFLVDGLKASLSADTYKTELEAALKEIN